MANLMLNYEKDLVCAFRSLDEAKIRRFLSSYPQVTEHEGEVDWNNPEVFWRVVHKVRTAMGQFTEEEKQISRDWLSAHGSESWG